MTRSVRLSVNGSTVVADAAPRTHLADFLRERAHLTGTHLGCEHGVCGACTLMVDGQPVRSCIAFAVSYDGSDVRTIEGFADDPLMQALRAAFTRHHALQCGYCTPGMLMTAYDIVRRIPDADDTRIREELSGNLCRCTGYMGIVDAIRSVLDAPPSLVDITTPLPAGLPLMRMEAMPRAESITRPVSPLQQREGPLGDEEAATYRVPVAASADALWQVLSDVAAVTRCLPGASLTGDADDDPVAFRMDVALGPMRVGFEGTATVRYQDDQRSACVEGRGHDARTRSGGEGTLDFSVDATDENASELAVSLNYALTGPLAQFSRGPVVDAVVEQMLQRFAANAARLAGGEAVSDQATVGGTRVALSALWARIRRWFGG